MPVQAPGSVAGTFMLRLDGVDSGFVKSVDGGAIYADVVNETSGQQFFVKKHIGAPRYEEFSIQIGWWMTKAIYDWIEASWKMNFQRKNGSIVGYDALRQARSERDFFNAMITEVSIPALDGSSKEPAYLTVKFAPEYTRHKPASGAAATPVVKAAQELWLTSNFRLEIAGLDCTRVTAVDSFTVKQTAAADSIGVTRDQVMVPGRLEFPNLTVTLAESSASSWQAWFEGFVINGKNGVENEKNGALIILSPNLQTELARVNFFNLGIFKLAPVRADGGADQMARVTARLYCDRMELQVAKPLIKP